MSSLAAASSSQSSSPIYPVTLSEKPEPLDELCSPMYQVVGSPVTNNDNEIVRQNTSALLQLQEFMINYPQDLQNLGTTVSGLKEFVTEGALLSAPLPDPAYEGFPHQKFITRLYGPYDKFLMYWGTGTGKSGGVIMAAEKLIRDPNSPINGALVLMSGEMLIKNFQRELLKFTPPGTYDTENVRNAKTDLGQKGVLTREFNTFYTMDTYGVFTRKIVHEMLGTIDSQERARWLRENPNDANASLNNWPLGQAPWEQRGNEWLRERFSNKFIILDEVQNLISDKTNKLFLLPEDRHRRKIERLDNKNRKKGGKTKKNTLTAEKIQQMTTARPLAFEKAENYILIHRIIHSAHNVKVAAMSADPMIDHSDQIIQVMNLLLPIEKQLDWKKNIDSQLDAFRSYIRGYISHVKSSNVGATVKRIGYKLEGSFELNGQHTHYDSIVCTHNMSPFQSYHYYRAVNNMKRDAEGKVEGNKFVDNAYRAMAAANFVYPNGSFGTYGYEQYFKAPRDPHITKDKDYHPSEDEMNDYNQKMQVYYDNRNRLAQCISNPVTLRMMSVKMFEIAQAVRRSFTQKGIVFIYSSLLRHSGVGVMIEVLRYYLGMLEFDSSTSVFVRGQPTLDEHGRERDRRLVNNISYSGNSGIPFRFALLSGDMTSRRDSILEVMTSRENRYGNIIKVVLSTEVGAVGVSYYHGIQFHALNPDLNAYRIKQAEARILRTISHEDLLNEQREAKKQELLQLKRQSLRNQGLPTEYVRVDDQMRQIIGQETIQVELYHHAAIPSDFPSSELEAIYIKDNELMVSQWEYRFPTNYQMPVNLGCEKFNMNIIRTPMLKGLSDIAFYSLSNQKEYKIRIIERIMKEEAVDCLINRDRNVDPTAIDGSKECDYNICNYPCGYPMSTTVDEVNYDNLYADKELHKISKRLTELFSHCSVVSYTTLYKLLSDYKRRFIHTAVNKLISDRNRLKDRFGFPMYLQEDGDSLFICRDDDNNVRVEVNNKLYSQVPYCNELIGIQAYSLQRIYQNLIEHQEQPLIDVLPQYVSNIEFFETKFKELSLNTQIKIYEKLLLNYMFNNDTNNPMAGPLYNMFKAYTYFVNIPQNTIDKYAYERAYPPPNKLGRKPNPLARKTTHKKINILSSDISKEKTYIHTIWLLDERNTSFGKDAKKTNVDTIIRILDLKQQQWRDANDYEYPVFNTLIVNYNNPTDANTFNLPQGINFPIYLRIGSGNSIRLVDKTMEKGTKGSNRVTGRNITSFMQAKVVYLFWTLYSGYQNYPGFQVPPAPIIDYSKQNITIENMKSVMAKKLDPRDGKPENSPINFTDPERIRYYYAWFINTTKLPGLHQYLKDLLLQLQLVKYD